MANWGFELYQNDTSLDVKDDFEKLYKSGLTVKEITNRLVMDYQSIFGKGEEEALFWLALADVQWNFGVLLPEVKEKAVFWIDTNYDILISQTIAMQEKKQKIKSLNTIKSKLLSPLPIATKPKTNRLYKCQWQMGDVFAYRLESDLAKERALYGKYFLIHKVDETVYPPGHIVPIVYIKITNSNQLPSNDEEYDQLDYVQTWFTRFEDRFLPIDMRCPQDDIAKKSKINYKVDEYGFLPQYRIKLLNTSKKVIPKNLIYVGNFSNVSYPVNEFVPHSKDNIVSASWNQFGETFETKMIKRYCGHNLRELSIYTQ